MENKTNFKGLFDSMKISDAILWLLVFLAGVLLILGIIKTFFW